MLTSRAKYAVRASMVLAERRGANGWTSAGALATEAEVPRKFLEAILTQLRDHGLVESRRGPAGGHRLAAEPAQVSVADVIRCIDGPLAMTPCASQTQFSACSDCASVEKCRIRHLMGRARDAVAAVLEACSLEALCAEGRDGAVAVVLSAPAGPEARTSFVKKNSKKLLDSSASASPDRLSPDQ